MIKTLIRATAAFTVVCLTANHARAASPNGAARYIVVLKHRGGAKPDIAKLNGSVEFDDAESMVVAIPEASVEGLRHSPQVKYIQRVVDGAEGVSRDASAMVDAPSVSLQAHSSGPKMQTNSVTPTWKSGDYAYDGAGNIVQIGTAAAPSGDNRTNAYTYDSVGRLKTATVNDSSLRSQGYAYDAFGNMTSIQNDGNMPESISVATATNRLTEFHYDSVGNVDQHGWYLYTWDPFNMLRKSQHGTGGPSEVYVYTASDERIGTLGQDDKWNWTLRDESGKVLREYRSSNGIPNASVWTVPWLWVEDHVWRDGVLLATERVAEEGGRRQYHLDHLGTARMVTGNNGVVASMHNYLPFGVEKTSMRQEVANGFDREEPMRFTGHERAFRDTSVENTDYIDYMHARWYAPNQARFLSVDPKNSSRPAVPQTWNRYVYALDNPVKYLDPDGRDAVVFIVAPYNDNFTQIVGHAAIYVRSGKDGAGVSAFGKNWFQNGIKGFIRDYAAHGQPVRSYVLKTTPQQDAAMLSFIKSTSNGVQNMGGTVMTSSYLGLGPRNNCTTGVDNVLAAGGVIRPDAHPGRSAFGLGIDLPKQLQESLESGMLSGLVTARRQFDESNINLLDKVDDDMNLIENDVMPAHGEEIPKQ